MRPAVYLSILVTTLASWWFLLTHWPLVLAWITGWGVVMVVGEVRERRRRKRDWPRMKVWGN
jgi:uncharacterized membrane protein AbrB (regulator of aidB expression)